MMCLNNQDFLVTLHVYICQLAAFHALAQETELFKHFWGLLNHAN